MASGRAAQRRVPLADAVRGHRYAEIPLSSGILSFFHYFIFVTVFSAAAFVCNECLGTNLMFLGNPFGLEFLRRIYEYSRCLYALTAYCAQAVLLFWVCYGLSRAVAVIRKRREVYG